MITKMSKAVALREMLERLDQKYERQGLLLEGLRKSIDRQERGEEEPTKRGTGMSVDYALHVLRKQRASFTWTIPEGKEFWQTRKDNPYYGKLNDRLDSLNQAISILEAWRG